MSVLLQQQYVFTISYWCVDLLFTNVMFFCLLGDFLCRSLGELDDTEQSVASLVSKFSADNSMSNVFRLVPSFLRFTANLSYPLCLNIVLKSLPWQLKLRTSSSSSSSSLSEHKPGLKIKLSTISLSPFTRVGSVNGTILSFATQHIHNDRKLKMTTECWLLYGANKHKRIAPKQTL